MYSRYKHGCIQDIHIHPSASRPYMPRQDMPGQGAMPESARIEQSMCPNAWFRSSAAPTCSGPVTQKIQLPTTGLTAIPVVTVETVPVSTTLQQRATQIQKIASDPYDPVTRFARYFPPAPLPYLCPERIPSNLPLPPETPCILNTRFQGSAIGR
jgi:hypothetical protein